MFAKSGQSRLKAKEATIEHLAKFEIDKQDQNRKPCFCLREKVEPFDEDLIFDSDLLSEIGQEKDVRGNEPEETNAGEDHNQGFTQDIGKADHHQVHYDLQSTDQGDQIRCHFGEVFILEVAPKDQEAKEHCT